MKDSLQYSWSLFVLSKVWNMIFITVYRIKKNPFQHVLHTILYIIIEMSPGKKFWMSTGKYLILVVFVISYFVGMCMWMWMTELVNAQGNNAPTLISAVAKTHMLCNHFLFLHILTVDEFMHTSSVLTVIHRPNKPAEGTLLKPPLNCIDFKSHV